MLPGITGRRPFTRSSCVGRLNTSDVKEKREEMTTIANTADFFISERDKNSFTSDQIRIYCGSREARIRNGGELNGSMDGMRIEGVLERIANFWQCHRTIQQQRQKCIMIALQMLNFMKSCCVLIPIAYLNTFVLQIQFCR